MTIIPNPNMWIGDGWLFCLTCDRYSFHDALSHPGERDCYLECQKCGTIQPPDHRPYCPLDSRATPVVQS